MAEHQVEEDTAGQNAPTHFELVYNVKLSAEPISGQDWLVEEPERARRLWKTQVYPTIHKLTEGRRLRLHVNIGGYGDHDPDNATLDKKCDNGVSGNRLKKVWVDDNGEVCIIIDKSNFQALFQSVWRQKIIQKVIANNQAGV